MIAEKTVIVNPFLQSDLYCGMLKKKGEMVMKDIPMFDTEYGVASLILKEIPYKQTAYVKILSSQEPEKLMAECVQFCRMCGAEIIDATGHLWLESYPLVTAIYALQCPQNTLARADACLFPVTEQTLARWLEIYNERMATVPNSAYMDSRDGKRLLETGDGYFVHRDGKLLGIGKAAADTVDAIISVQPGMGETVLRTLATALSEEGVRLTVAGANKRAMRLYERLGFVKTAELSRWYRILGK
jgi:GNAT superfamily N-acetyltransferase